MDDFTRIQLLVRNSGLPFKQIAEGADVGERWLRKFVDGDFADSGIRRLERLRVYLLDQREVMV